MYKFALGEVRFTWCRNPRTGYFFPFDFVIEKFKIIIELDGEYHSNK
jgi:very-short-patch-repair endonuclease